MAAFIGESLEKAINVAEEITGIAYLDMDGDVGLAGQPGLPSRERGLALYRLPKTPIEAIEATRLPASTPGPCTRAPAGRRPLVKFYVLYKQVIQNIMKRKSRALVFTWGPQSHANG